MTKLEPDVQHHPVVVKQWEKRAADFQLRMADRITSFAGSMAFVWIHVVIFAVWIVVLGMWLQGDPYPFGMLTMIVSLEAIFLSTFVMIGQNRQAAFQQAKADHDFTEQEALLKENTELTKAIHELTRAVHERLLGPAAPASVSATSSVAPPAAGE